MDAEIICVGTELLMGQTLNTNAHYLAQKLNELGMNHYFQTVVGDNQKRLKQCLQLAEKRSDVIILTGGLGPTQDDQSKEIVAEYLEETLSIDLQAYADIKADLAKSHRSLNKNDKKMASYFKKGQSFKNSVGQAVGTAIKVKQTLYVLLPGPPREMQAMFKNEVHSFLKEYMDENIYITSRYLNYFGVGESQLAENLDPLITNQNNPTLAIYTTGQAVMIRLTAYGTLLSGNHDVLDLWVKKINQQVGRWFYGEGYDLTPAKALVRYLKRKKLSLSLAESLTGGDGANQIVNVSGASQVFKGGIVAYDKSAKTHVLGVDSSLLDQHGMVSSACAKAMAEEARVKFQTDLAISWTGVAGPDKMEGQEVGTVFIGLARKNKDTLVKECHFHGDRQTIRQRAINYAYVHLLQH